MSESQITVYPYMEKKNSNIDTTMIYAIKNGSFPWNEMTKITHSNIFNTESRHLTTLKEIAFETIVGQGENAGNQHFLLLPQCFLFIPY